VCSGWLSYVTRRDTSSALIPGSVEPPEESVAAQKDFAAFTAGRPRSPRPVPVAAMKAISGSLRAVIYARYERGESYRPSFDAESSRFSDLVSPGEGNVELDRLALRLIQRGRAYT